MVLIDKIFWAIQEGEFPFTLSFATKSRRQGRKEKAEVAGRRERQANGTRGDGARRSTTQEKHNGRAPKIKIPRMVKRAMGIKSTRKH